MDSKKLEKILDQVEWATLNVVIQEKYSCLIIPQEKWTAVSEALHDEVGDGGWNDEWDY